MGGRSSVVRAAYWIAVSNLRMPVREIRQASPRARIQELEKGSSTGEPIRVSELPRKVPKIKNTGSVPKTDTGGQVE
ncbi:MAG: hypothetical protein COY10_01115 [Candidatus Portnoybacteria bacterium CG_4_10_14_0_2_um_filter_43_36]|uniref:Uncharacterized protein n=2 Tax=Candidatus Portnoyibacteriota TaxID=1817913 RepID=A0A2M7YME1_9BACT|nr:MAG: hypothetical protein COY10_01115 [Candidatus Portnoybacteria bacterium CG_4_10_14_0_2_um_filter_43_36]PJA64154.1 MAG: hypothetical protein CO160_00120 [Candidatus Portnoybacteria bacterium CG_4_9_14_3_um_filter_43_11]